MDGIVTIAQVRPEALEAQAARPAANQQPVDPHPNVSFDQGRSATSDFTAMLDGFRARSDKLHSSVQKATAGTSAKSREMRQLADLYSFAVDTQILVRTSGQLTSGLRQLVTGQ